MSKANDLKKVIEVKRSELNVAGGLYGLGSDIVLIKSKELDELLNQYNRNILFKSAAK
ncbi:aspartyl-phosphate phosphatase Spo0E family protein [Paenibacillus vini]|uniref:aspartyl-phosphate phosphatase Spo0E family protein n=1 Tax=Paenibacillus vini TaxID=1476024 RepID=UPI0025B689ED|nr:aspartyl-phosphate phosphatase Spo0E family protein [Paenibacillus vini]MDN4067509.1 aspartyl-phosphate phosphatase Spo0E family protein [Paenibacillus vini]